MRILLITQYFFPENFKSNDIAFELVKRGHIVDALVSIPNYPEGTYYKGFGILRKRIQKIQGVTVYRAFQTPRGKKASGICLAINYITYAICASAWALLLSIFRKYDSIVVFQPSPITQALPAILIRKIRKTPVYLWVLDIWPNVAYYNLKTTIAKEIINRVSALIYNNSFKILISSKLFKQIIEDYIGLSERIIYFPNWSEDYYEMPKMKISELPKGFKIMMAGNLGQSQKLDSVLRLIQLLKDQNCIKWIFIGDGSRRQFLEEYIKANHLEKIVFVLGRFPLSYMSSFYEQADAMLLSLMTHKPHLQATVPLRLQSYMSAGKPILAMAGKGVQNIITEADCGYAIVDDDVEKMETYIRENVISNYYAFSSLGVNSRKYFLNNFTIQKCIDNLELILLKRYE